jgi:threonine/homoserine/homoserine lactone efflux protein
MPDAHVLYLFAIASAGLVVLPGPAMIYIVTRGVVHGRRGGLISVAGIEAGNLLAVIAATAGLAAIVASSAAAFAIVKYAGAAYLIALGLAALLRGRATAAPPSSEPRERHLFWHGFAVGALNPKLALFLLAFLPQFIDPANGPIWLQTLVLGSVFSVMAAIGDTAVALAAGTAGSRIRRALAGRRIAFASGGVYLALGVGAALAEGRAHR